MTLFSVLLFMIPASTPTNMFDHGMGLSVAPLYRSCIALEMLPGARGHALRARPRAPMPVLLLPLLDRSCIEIKRVRCEIGQGIRESLAGCLVGCPGGSGRRSGRPGRRSGRSKESLGGSRQCDSYSNGIGWKPKGSIKNTNHILRTTIRGFPRRVPGGSWRVRDRRRLGCAQKVSGRDSRVRHL